MSIIIELLECSYVFGIYVISSGKIVLSSQVILQLPHYVFYALVMTETVWHLGLLNVVVIHVATSVFCVPGVRELTINCNAYKISVLVIFWLLCATTYHVSIIFTLYIQQNDSSLPWHRCDMEKYLKYRYYYVATQ